MGVKKGLEKGLYYNYIWAVISTTCMVFCYRLDGIVRQTSGYTFRVAGHISATN